MRLLNTVVGPSALTDGFTRITARIVMDIEEEMSLWVDVPDELKDGISDSGNPWVIAMLPIAAARHENIQLSLPVDALLLENLRGISKIWSGWYPELSEVAIDCSTFSSIETLKPEKCAAFFSGGIDSYYTIARRLPDSGTGLPVVGHIDDLLSVWGFDVSANDEASFSPMAKGLISAAKQIRRKHAIIRTNLRDNRTPWFTRWGPLTNGAGLAFISLVLEKRYRQVVLGSSFPNYTYVDWGSHPLVDHLFSTSATQIVHDGPSVTRVQKTDLAAQFPPAQSALHVCHAIGDDNCSECEKCYRTMITLDILGHKERMSKVFDWSKYHVEAVRKIKIGSKGDKVFYGEILDAARAAKRADLVSELESAGIRSRTASPALKTSEWLMQLPGLWRAGMALRKFVLRNSITAKYIKHSSDKP
ncbi:hypothetical protein [Undibacterium terreum]|uniref:Uncharacterized protein n=1 Tax=Undibacterium terreum TaxID=1224302 RepID=A0A916V1C9_9BURK|nr:hypothetical protein [Undibacterium terreum]GGC96076.1 hypothetical protein GCM10011396_49350 [Undibacterium terreum]